MKSNAQKRRIWFSATAVIIAVALLLSCALAAFLYTRTGDIPENGNTTEGGDADDNSLLNAQYSYGDRRPGDVVPSGSYVMNISSADDLTNFLSSTVYTYGILTQDISISSANITSTGGEVKPSTNRVLSEGKTLDGNGHTITTYFFESATLDCRRVDGGLRSDWYKSYFTFQQNGTNTAVDIGNGISAFGVSNIVSVNRGTIKNLKVSVSAASGRESVAKAVVTAPEGYNGNIGMGVVAGINFGTVENCVSTVNIQYGFYGSPVQAWSNTASNSNNKILSKQGIVAVGGVVGINKGNVLNTKVNQNSDIGTYRPVYTVEYDWNNKETGEIYNDNIGSGIVGGVAGLNDGGVVNGVEYNATAGNLRNQNNHTSVSYTGLFVGLANLQNAKGGTAVNFNVGYYSGGDIQKDVSMPVAAGSVQNIKYTLNSGYSAATEAYAFSGSRGGFMTISNSSWTATGSYVGFIGGRVTTNNTVAEKIVTGGVSFDAGKYAYRAWENTELNATLAFADNSMPLFGYGNTTKVTSDHYQNLYVAARLDGQNTESQKNGDFSDDGLFLNKAQIGYVWDSYANDNGEVVNRVLYNVNFDNMQELAGKTYSVYKEEGFVESVGGSVVYGSDDYRGASLSDGGRIEWSAGVAPSWVLMLYSLRINDFSSVEEFEAFARTDTGASGEYFAYAYANAVMLTTTNTLNSPSVASDKVLRDWKTLDGNGQRIVVNNARNYVSGASVVENVGGIGLYGISDLISVNEGTVKNLKVSFAASSREGISYTDNFAYGRVIGINKGIIENIGVNNDADYGDSTKTVVSTTADYGFTGLAVGANLGTINNLHVIMWQTVSAQAGTVAAAGGAVGINSGGTLRNVTADGVSSASLKAGSTSGESYVGGILGAGSNFGEVRIGAMTLSAPSDNGSPFENWTFAGKQKIETQGAYAGMLAGRLVGGATKAENGNSDEYMIREMVVMMPQINSAVGWFTNAVGKMSLLGAADGAAADSGYIATDLVIGYYIYIDDASTSYISRIYRDYNAVKSGTDVTAIFTSDVYNGSAAVRSLNAVSLQTEHMSSEAAGLVSFTANLSSASQAVSVPTEVGRTLAVFAADANEGNFAPAIKLNYDYDVNLSQTASDADSSSQKSSLEMFVTGDDSSASGISSHKIIAAGANGAVLTSGMTLTVTIAAEFTKARGLDGNGNTVTYTPGAMGGILYANGGEELTAVGVIASVNKSVITDIAVVLGGGAATNLGSAYAFGGITGINLGTVNGTFRTEGRTLSVTGNTSTSYFGGAVGINRGIADGTRAEFNGGTLAAENNGTALAVIGGVIGLQDSPSLTDVQATGYGATLTVSGSGAVGGVIGAANAGSNGNTVVTGLVSAVQTTLTDIANAVYGMTLNAESGYKGLITACLGEGEVRNDSLSGIAAFYPDGVEDYTVPWTTSAVNTLSMYGYNASGAGNLEGILFRISDFSKDGAAEFLTKRSISVNGAVKSFSFDSAQIASLSSLSFDINYYYYNTDGVLVTDDSYSGTPVQSGSIYTTSVNGVYGNNVSYVPTLDVLLDYLVSIGNAENVQLVDFMRGESSSGYESYAGARSAVLDSGASFALDGNTSAQRTESLGTKVLAGSGNTVNISGSLPSVSYEGNVVSGGFFAVNRAEVRGINVVASSAISLNAYAFGLFAGVNEGNIADVSVTMSGISMTGGVFGAAAGINKAQANGIRSNLSGVYTVTSDKVFAGGAFGENSANVSDVTVAFNNAALTANPVSIAATGGVAGKQNGGSLENVGTSGGTASMSVTSGNGYIGGVVGIINTGMTVQTVAGEQLDPSSMAGVYGGAYTSAMNGGTGVYKGLIAGAVGSIASGKICGAAANYFENGYEKGDYSIPWFTADGSEVSMYGYNTVDADTAYATGVVFKISDYSDDGAADFVKTRSLASGADSAVFTFSLAEFNGANDLNIKTVRRVYENGGLVSTELDSAVYATSGTFSFSADNSLVNGGGQYVPTLEFFATYSVNITSGTEADLYNNPDGIANSMLYCFIDGVGNNQLYAGAETGYITQSMLIYKPANGYVTMSADKMLVGGGNTLMFAFTGSYVLQLNDREKDNAGSGSGGYEQTEVYGDVIGSAGALIAVNRGTITDLRIEIKQTGYYLTEYSSAFADNAAFGMLAGVNYGEISDVYFYNYTQYGRINVTGNGSSEIVYGGIVGVNAEEGAVRNLTVDKHSEVNISGVSRALYGGVVGQNYGTASDIVLNNFSANTIGQVERGVYGGAVGSNNGTLSNVRVTVGTEISQDDFLTRLGKKPDQRTIYLTADDLAVWGGVVGYNAGNVSGATLLANVNYGMSAGAGDLSAGGVIGMNDGGSLSGIEATGWGGFYVYSSAINMTATTSVFVGGLVGSMNADGAVKVGFIEFANSAKATLSDSVFALSGGMVTMNSYAVGNARYGYVTGAFAEVYGNIPEGAVRNTFWFISDKLSGVEGENAEILPAFHGGNAQNPAYISVFGKAPSDWLTSGVGTNAAVFASDSYGFNLVDSDDNPINYLTMDVSLSGGTLTINVHKPSGVMFINTPDFNGEVTGSGGTGSGSVGAGGGKDQTLTVSNAGSSGIGYVTFSFESSVYAMTESAYSAYTEYMIISFLSTKPFGVVDGSSIGDYYSYTTVDGENSRAIGDAVYRVYQVWSGATEMRVQGSNNTIEIDDVPSRPLILGKGKTFNGGQNNGNKIKVNSSFQNNIALYSFDEANGGTKQTYLVVSEFLAVNYGTFTNADVTITGTDGHDIFRTASDVIANAPNAGIDLNVNELTGFIYGMLVGVNEGVISELGGYSFDRTIELNSNAGAKYNSIFGGMVGAQSGPDALIKDIGDLTFGTAERAGGITMNGNANLVAAGGVVGIAIDGRIENLSVKLTANSFISVQGAHNVAAVGGVVGDLRGVLSQVVFESEYQSEMKISDTNQNGTAALGNIAGIINTFESSTETAAIRLAKVTGVGYLYNGIDENGTVTTSSTKLYTAGVVALGSNYGVLTADNPDPYVQDIVKAYGEIRPSVLDSIYIDFEGYVRAKANTRVGLITARILDGITSETSEDGNVTVNKNINYDNLKNLVWQTSYEGDTNWAESKNYADYTETLASNTAVSLLGYAPVAIDSSDPDMRGVGMRLWLTNNLYSPRLTTADMVTGWIASGQLNVSITGSLGWRNMEISLSYYDESGADLSARYKQINSLGSLGAASSASVQVNVETALAEISASQYSFPHGIYMLRVTYNEVYITNAKELMTFMSSGADVTQGLPSSDGNYSGLANANIGIIANDISVDYASGSGSHRYATAVTMRADKILEGNGNKVTILTSGNIHSAVLDSKGNTPAGALLTGESYWDYIGGTNVLTQGDINNMEQEYAGISRIGYKIGIRAGGLFLGRNLGTIQNINFVMPNSVRIDNHAYAKWFDVINQDSWRNYGTSLYAGIVTAVNAGTIDNCTLTLEENVTSNALRATCDGPALQKGYTNELKYKINTLAVNGGFAGVMYGTADRQSIISNCSVNLSEGSVVRAESQVSSFSWSGRSDSVYAYAGGVVGWLTSDSLVYNVTVNGTGTMTAWGELDMGGKSDGFSDGDKVTNAGVIVGLNSDHSTFTVSSKEGEYGIIDGVICNWNGAAYFLSTGNNNIYQTGSRVNFYIGAQLAGVAEQNTLNNIYFMYGIDQYKTFHMDNWYYGDNVAARQANSDFKHKYDYIVSRSLQLLNSDNFGYTAIYAIVQKAGGNPSLTEVAYKDTDGSVVVNLEDKTVQGTTIPAFTFENYANYQNAIDGTEVSGAKNFSLYVASGTTFYTANQYFPRITATLDSGGNKNLDFVGARAAAMMTSNGSADWNRLFKPNNVYIYEVGFGSSVDEGVELDMNDPDTTASLSFQTNSIVSDVAINISLSSGSLGAQFVWEIQENWHYSDGSTWSSNTSYYNNVTSLEQAKQNNNFSRIFDRDNDGADYTFTYVMGLAVKIAMDTDRYYYDDTEGVFYDSVAKIYDGTVIDDPLLYYADEDGNRINMPELGLGEVSASVMSPTYYKDNENGAVNVNKVNTDDAGAYRIRITFSSEGGENSKVNTSNRTIMFSEFDYIDIYTVVLPRGVTQSGVFVYKTYDGSTSYGESVTNFSNMVGNDRVALSEGRYQTANAGSGTIFAATYNEFTFLYVENGVITQKTIETFAGRDQTSNYAPVSTAITATSIKLSENSVSPYVRPTASFAYKGEIYRKQIKSTDLTLYVWGDQFIIGNVNHKTFNALTEYDTEAFKDGSRILGQSVTYRQSGGNSYLQIDGYAPVEKLDFYFTFDDGSAISQVVKDKASYTVYLNINDASNFVFWTGMEETESLNVGTLLISEYEIQTADVTYVIEDGFLDKIFDNTSAIPFTFDKDNLRIIAQDGYEVQPDEYTLTTSDMFAVKKGDQSLTGINAVDSGEYDIYFRISNFTAQNYTLVNMSVRFVDSSGRQISYFVLPREIVLESVTKEFDNTVSADGAAVSYGQGPVKGTNDGFAFEYGSVDAGAGLDIIFTGTGTKTLNGKTYITLDVIAGANRGKDNYYVASETAKVGNITPVLVVVSGVSMIYNNNVIVDYRKEGTSVTIKKDSDGTAVNIYPAARFTDKSAGTNKQVNFETTNLIVAGKTYSVLENADQAYVNGNLPTSGEGFAGNYYVSKSNWIVGEIVKNTLTLDDILGNVTIMQTNGSTTAVGTSYLFEELRGKSYTYRYAYYIGYEVNPNATVIADDPLKDHLAVKITHSGGYQNGYAGTYTLELIISSSDYDWDEEVSDADRRITDFKINMQRITADNLTVTLAGGQVYSYRSSTYRTTISPTLVMTDADGRRVSSEKNEIEFDLSQLSNGNEYFRGNYANGSTLPVGDYTAAVTPKFVGDDNVNYYYTGSGSIVEFSVIPYQIASINVTKEFDNGTSLSNPGKEVVIDMSSQDKFVPKGSFASSGAGINKPLNISTVSTVINKTPYSLILDENDNVTNYVYISTGARGTIEKYEISSAELNMYVSGWVKDMLTRQLMSVKSGTSILEYRSDEASGYKAEHFLFGTVGMDYNFTGNATAPSVTIMQGGATVATLNFTITLNDGTNTYIYRPGDTETSFVLKAGVYNVSLDLNHNNFELGSGAGIGTFTVAKQEIDGGGAAGSANIFIALGGDFSYVYGEGRFNMPAADDEKFRYTLSIIDKYTGKVTLTFTEADAVIELIEYSLTADATEFFTVLDGPLYVGGYYVWASTVADALGDYAVPAGTRIAVYTAGTPVPEVPDQGEGEDGEEGSSGGDGDGTVVIPSLPAEQAYFVLPRTLNVESVAKTYDGTDSFVGAVMTSDALTEDGLTVGSLDGVYASPNANYDSTGTVYIEGNKGSDYLLVNVTEITVNGMQYYVLSADGISGNYCLNGELNGRVMKIAGAKIMRKSVDSTNVAFASDTFEKTYGSEEEVVLPDVAANLNGVVEYVTYTSENVIYKQGGEIVDPVNVGGYEMYLSGIAFDNYEVSGLGGEILVNAGRNVVEEGEGQTGEDQGGETGEGGEETEPETYTFYIVPQEIVIADVVKFYDRNTELAYYGEEEEGISADVKVTDAEGNEILDSEGNPIVLRIQGRMSDASSGTGKDVYADFTPFGYYVNFDVANVSMFYRLLLVGEDGSANVASNYCIAASETALLPPQFDEDYVPEDPENDDTPVINNDLIYNMTLVGIGTVIPSPLTIEGISKTYDGTYDIVGGALTGFFEGDEAMTAARWRYDTKDAGSGKPVGIETDGTEYRYGDKLYYAIYMVVNGEKILSDYSVESVNLVTVDETVKGEDGSETVETVMYAVVDGIGTITPLELTAANFSGVNVDGKLNTEYNSNTVYGVSQIRATLSALGFTAQAVNVDGVLTFTLGNGDELVFTATFGGAGSAHNAGTYPVTLTLTEGGNYTTSAPYTVNFIITKQSITRVYVITGALAKVYDGTGDLPAYSAAEWQVYAVDKQGALIDMTTFGDVDTSSAKAVFIRYNEESKEYEYFDPVNVTAEPGYQIYVNGITLDGSNYVFTSTEDAYGCISFNETDKTFETAYYKIEPRAVEIADGAFDSKKFDGAFSLRVDGGVQGETVIVGDKSGVNASLAGVYGTLDVTPYVTGVAVAEDAINPDSVAQNYALYYGGSAVTDSTIIQVSDYTVTQADILVAERDNGKYAIGISGLQGLDFLFAKTADFSQETVQRIINRLLTGETWSGGSFDSSSDFAKLNKAVFDVFSVYLNNGESAVIPSVADRYVADSFKYTAQDGAYVLTFTFGGLSGYDADTATDRYAFVINGYSDGVNSTNYSVTSSELESGQTTDSSAGAGVAVSNEKELKEAIADNQNFYLTQSIYGVDMKDASAVTFTGTMDGRGHTISLTGRGASTGGSAGMLVAVNEGRIENLVVKLMPTSELNASVAGGLAGINNGVISNVSVELISDFTVTGAIKVGGVAGENGVGASMIDVSFVYSADVSAQGAAWGSLAGNNAGYMEKTAVRVNEGTGARNYAISAGSAGYAAGISTGEASGMIVAIPSGRLSGVSYLWGSGTTTATDVYSYVNIGGESGGQLSLLDPYTEGYIGYYFATADDYTTGTSEHNGLTSADEYNKSYYVDYTGGKEGYIAVEAIAPYNRFIWDGYGISYRTAFGDGNVGSALNRIVALFAQGGIEEQFDGTTVITAGVNAFTVAIGVRGGTVEVEGDVETSVKEVVYTGVAQVYKVNITVTSGGVSETKELSVAGTDAGYYSKASLEGIIGGGTGGETIGDVTYDSGSRTEYTFSGEGTKVASGIALVIYPKQIDSETVSANKYYDTSTEGTLSVSDGEKSAGSLTGNYYGISGEKTSQVADAVSFGFADFGTLTRNVLAKDGVLYGITEKVVEDGDNVVTTYEIAPITVGNGEEAVQFSVSDTVGKYDVRDLMIAYSRLADEVYARSVLTQEQLVGYEFVRVYNLTADVTAGTDNVATVSGAAVLRPVLAGQSGGNYSLYSAQWNVSADMTVGAEEATFALNENAMTVAGAIMPVDLGVTAEYTVGKDQSYNSEMLLPQAMANRTVNVTEEQAAALGISAENYAKLVAEVAAGISVSFGDGFFDALVSEGVVEKRADGKYYTTAEYSKYCNAELPSSAEGGNFVITLPDNTVTFRYFGTTLKEGKAFYTLTSSDDYAKWINNEGNTADYYEIDMLLVSDIDFGGRVTDMLAWRDADGNVVGYKGVFDGDGNAFINMLLDRDGSAALFERIDEGAIVRNLTVADSVIISAGTGSVAGGIAVDNYGSVENCAFEGVLSADAKTGGIAATNYGSITGGVSVNRAYVGADGNAEGIAENADDGSGNAGNAEGASITESFAGSGASTVENTVAENADGDVAEWTDEAFVPVITAYVFDETYVKVDGYGKFVTDNFFKLNAVDKLFGWVGAEAVTNASQTGFYGTLILK